MKFLVQMKYLYHCLIISSLLLATGELSAQEYRVRFDLGATGVFNSFQIARPTAALGLEALFNVSPRTFIVPELGVQQTHIFHDGLRPPPPFIAGQRPIEAFSEESYEMKQTSAYLGLGMEQHVHRFRFQVYGRMAKRLADRVIFRESIDFQVSGRPENLFSVSVRPGEVFTQDIQQGTLRYSQELSFHTGLSVRFDLTEGFELGVAYLHAVGYPRLERRVISFCENCPVNPDTTPERSIDAVTNSFSISGRYTLR